MSGQAGASSAAGTTGNTIEGCLGGSAGKFTIIDKAGVTYHLMIPASADTSKLNQHIGQEVAVTGTVTNNNAAGAAAGGAGSASSPSASEPSSMGSNPTGSSAAGSSAAGAAGSSASGTGSSATNSGPSIQVSKIDKVADTCSTNSTGSANPSH